MNLGIYAYSPKRDRRTAASDAGSTEKARRGALKTSDSSVGMVTGRTAAFMGAEADSDAKLAIGRARAAPLERIETKRDARETLLSMPSLWDE
jgi:hypothetical protein